MSGDFTLSLGYNSDQASVVACIISLGNFFGPPFFGRLADRVGPVSTSIAVKSIVGFLSFAMWIPDRNYSTAIAFGLSKGSMMATVWDVTANMDVHISG
jgi:MFS family permease